MTQDSKRRRRSAAKRFVEVERISVLGISENGAARPAQVSRCVRAARALSKPKVPFEPARPYLVCHAIELGLKAFLSLRGASITTYYAGKVFEHPAVDESLSAYPQIPPIDTLFEAADRLVEALRQPCRETK